MREEDQAISFSEWLDRVPEAMKSDPLWHVQAYRMALYAADIG